MNNLNLNKGDFVLFRKDNTHFWDVGRYQKTFRNLHLIIHNFSIKGWYKEIIPFKGNEHLLWTKH